METYAFQLGIAILIAIPIVAILSKYESGDALIYRLMRVKKRSSVRKSDMADNDEVDKSQKRKKLEKYLDVTNSSKKVKKNTIGNLIVHAGLSITVVQFYVLSAVFTFVVLAVGIANHLPTPIAIGSAILAGAIVPRVYLNMRIDKLKKSFIKSFPQALDIIIRGVKTGFSVNESLKLVVAELEPPVSTEFGLLMDSLKIGIPLDEALYRFYNRNPSREARFFSILLIIQNKSGGNLSEALDNLANMIRDRAALLDKISTLSGEAKASAMIMGALPFCISGLIYAQTPDYFAPFFESMLGTTVLIGSLLWMFVGFIVMLVMMRIKV